MEHQAHVKVECPQCHWRYWQEIEIEETLLRSPLFDEIQAHLQEWITSHCPDHLGAIAQLSKN